MGIPQTPSSPPHLYPQALQLKLYQAFIFSIPILFSIILFLLFYLFYLKRRASSLISQPVLPRTANQAATYLPSTCQMGLKVELRDKLPIVLFDEELQARDSQCCVCLGEFELKEELLQVPSCKHVFHVECINHWLRTNSTCPLCRCSVVPTTKTRTTASTRPSFSPQHESSGPPAPLPPSSPPPPPPSGASTRGSNSPGEVVIDAQGSSSRSTCLMESNGLSNTSTFLESSYQHTESIALQIQTHDS